VKIYLPRARAAVGIGQEKARAVEVAPTGSPDEVVLVVDDDPAVLQTSVETLRELNYSVRHATSGTDALGVMQTMPGIRLLFTDVVMPGMSGRELVKRAQTVNPALWCSTRAATRVTQWCIMVLSIKASNYCRSRSPMTSWHARCDRCLIERGEGFCRG
jgi:CheY-like chemotaxis protein